MSYNSTSSWRRWSSTRSETNRTIQTDVCACPVCFANVCLTNRDKPKIGRFSYELKPKTKRLRLDYDAHIITSPIKGTQTKYLCNEEVHTCKPGRTTAVVARPYIMGLNGLSKRRHEVSTWRVLLDSGTDGDLLFREKDIRSKNMSIPYVNESWYDQIS